MTVTVSASAPLALQRYYRVLSGGIDAYGRGEDLRPLLTEHLDFTGSVAGHHPDATDTFLVGVAGFIATVQHIRIVQEVHDHAGSAVLYDATMPGGPVRLAEFFRFQDGLISTLNLHYDGQDYLAKGGR
ncbi:MULTISPECIES: hypothetical protein [unclassified Streptomyces]|uniref:hypothetical protein n=1 Tax=unclassified Streptomyces TaxID=2593676 RepID=UPI0035D55032